MKNLMWLAGIMLSSALFVGCGANKDDNNNTATACPPRGIVASDFACTVLDLCMDAYFKYL